MLSFYDVTGFGSRYILSSQASTLEVPGDKGKATSHFGGCPLEVGVRRSRCPLTLSASVFFVKSGGLPLQSWWGWFEKSG